MKQDDLDKTQLMRPVDGQRSDDERKFDTQPLPRIEDNAERLDSGYRGVRELPPEEIPPRVEKPKAKPFFTAGKKRGILLAICFVAALLGGFMLAGYSQDQSEAKQNQQQMERQQMQAREQKLADQEADLKARREGDVLGNRQHGAETLKLVNVVDDAELIALAHDDALRILADDPALSHDEHAALARELETVFSRYDDSASEGA